MPSIALSNEVAAVCALSLKARQRCSILVGNVLRTLSAASRRLGAPVVRRHAVQKMCISIVIETLDTVLADEALDLKHEHMKQEKDTKHGYLC